MKNLFYLLITITFLFSCEEDTPLGNQGGGNQGGNNSNQNTWTIPVAQVFDGGPGRDGIPAIDNPPRTDVAGGSYLIDPELVVGFYDGEKAIAYPLQILDWHEVINDSQDFFNYAITYCPLTGTPIGWDRNVGGRVVEFGVSGLIYNNNLIPFDRQTNSNWSQARLDCVNGPLIETRINTFQLVETRWSTWKEMFPDTEVITRETGHDRPYGVYPYGDYRTNENNLLFPLSSDDRRLNRKERVHGIISSGSARVYRFGSFGNETSLILDNLNGDELMIAGNTIKNFMVSFYRELPDGALLEFQAVNGNGSVILSDNEGNLWDVFGFAVEGPRTGQRLKRTESFMGYWFAWGTFYPGVEIYE